MIAMASSLAQLFRPRDAKSEPARRLCNSNTTNPNEISTTSHLIIDGSQERIMRRTSDKATATTTTTTTTTTSPLAIKSSTSQANTKPSLRSAKLSSRRLLSSAGPLVLFLLLIAACSGAIRCADDSQNVASESAPVVAAREQSPSEPAELKPVSSLVSSSGDRNDKITIEARGETLHAAESGPELSAAGAGPASGEQLSTTTEPGAQQTGEVPAVSGLVSQDEAGQSTQTVPTADEEPQQVSQGQADQQQQPQQQQIGDGEMQAQISVATGSGRAEGGAALPTNENDVPAGDQFGRKQSTQQPTTAATLAGATDGQVGLGARLSALKGPRSLKRAFGGHMGVFGRKRSQFEEQQQTEQPVTTSAATTRAPAKGRHNHHYYYQTLASNPTTAAPAPAQTTRLVAGRPTKLRNADFPDYREILVQPDQAERQQQQEQAAKAAAGKQVAVEQQKTEQASEAEAGEQSSEGQQQPETPTVAEQPQVIEQQAEGQQKEQPQEAPAQPYIRLSNIATINSTTGGSGNSSGGGEMKLMRIYVIDLDQKLVVGGQQSAGAAAAAIIGADQQQQQQASSQAAPATTTPGYEQQTVAVEQQTSEQQAPELQTNEQQTALVAGQDQYTKASEATNSYLPATTSPILSELYTSQSVRQYDQPQQQHQQHQQQPQHQHQQHYARPSYEPNIALPDGYVLVDREQLNGNLSQLVAQMSHYDSVMSQQQESRAGNYSQPAGQAHNYGYANHTGHGDYETSHYQGQGQGLSQNQSSAQVSGVYGANKQSVGYPVQVQHQMDQQQHPQPHQVLAVYPQPVQQPQQPQQQQHSAQVYLSVPQYIAPQYKQAAPGPGGEYELHQQPQTGNPSEYWPQHNGNYTGAASAGPRPVQAPSQHSPVVRQQQDKQGAYEQQAGAVYQREQAYKGPATSALPSVGLDQRWRPLDYAAPVLAGAAYPSAALAQAQAPPNPAQYAPNLTYATLNGYKDHDVVSLYNASHGARPQAQQQQQQHYAAYNNATDYDGQHAPLNYTAGQKYAGKQAHYVNTTGLDSAYDANSSALAVDSGADSDGNLPMPIYFASGPSDAPSHHPSSHGAAGNQQQQYNGTLQADYALASANSSAHNQRQPNYSPVTNEYAATYPSQAEQQQQQYDTAAYAKANRQPKQQQQQHSYKAEASNSDYRPQQMSRPQHSTGPYLAASGPPVADGVYEQEPHEADPEQVHLQPARPSRPKGAHQRPRASRQKQAAKYRGGNKYQAGKQAGELSAAYTLQPTDYFAADQHQGDASLQLALEQPQPPMLSPAGGYMQRPAPQYAAAAAPPMPSYYRPMGGAKGLLSWETISSAASSAAKRLPSLSSILMSPFSASVGVGPKALYPTANYPAPSYGMQQHAGQVSFPSKSAHYDRDVSAFHRPYPLRHMGEQTYAGQQHHHHAPETSDGEYASDDHIDLSSSSSSAASQDSLDSHELPESGKQVKLQLATSNATSLHEPDKQPRGPQVAEVSDLAEINPDLIGGRPGKSAPSGAKKAKPAAAGQKQRAKLALESAHAMDEHLGHQSSDSDSEQEEAIPAPPKPFSVKVPASVPRAPRRHRKRPAPQTGDFVEPSITGLSVGPAGEPMNLEALPADQQRLLLKGARQVGPAAGVMFPSAEAGAGELAGGRAPMAGAARPPNSMQIGQYKITPQTQFVQSIIEPSRQMLGQYFKQYIGQLGQFAHGRR